MAPWGNRRGGGPHSIQDTVRRWAAGLPQGLRDHLRRVEDIAQELAVAHRLDEERARLCAQAHDLCRAMPGGRLLEEAGRLDIPVNPVEARAPILLHGPVAAELLRREGLDDRDVYLGVYHHSTACPGLPPIAKAVFLADKLDPRKASRYPYSAELKATAMGSLDAALLEFLTREIGVFLTRGQLVHPASIEARNELLLRGAGP